MIALSTTDSRLGQVVIDVDDPALVGIGGECQSLPLEEWPAYVMLADPVTQLPLPMEQWPMIRALTEGSVENVAIRLRTVDGWRVARVCAYASFDSDGSVRGLSISMEDITDLWSRLVTAGVVTEPGSYTLHRCACGDWEIRFPIGTPLEWVDRELRAHMQDCVVLAAHRIKTFG